MSALFFTGPERSLPIYELDFEFFVGPNTVVRPGKLIGPVQEESITPAAHLAAGFVLDGTPAWLGRNFRAEASSDFWWVDTKETQRLPQIDANNYANAYLFDRSSPNRAVIWSGLIYPGEWVPTIERAGEYRYVDGRLAFKTDYAVAKWLTLSPSLGVAYADLDYDAQINCLGQTEHYVLKEHLDTTYTGALAGLDVSFRPTQRLALSIGGTLSPLWTKTKGKVFNSWEYVDNPSSLEQYGFSNDDTDFAVNATATGSVSYQPVSWFKVTASGGVEYWSKVARYKYPDYQVGDNPWVATGFPRIDYGHMTNFRAGLNFTFIIGK